MYKSYETRKVTNSFGFFHNNTLPPQWYIFAILKQLSETVGLITEHNELERTTSADGSSPAVASTISISASSFVSDDMVVVSAVRIELVGVLVVIYEYQYQESKDALDVVV